MYNRELDTIEKNFINLREREWPQSKLYFSD